MLTIIRDRDSGKAKQLLEAARKANCAILTQDKHSFEVKARGYGFEDVPIIDYEDLKDDNYEYGGNILIHNGDKVLEWIFDYFYGINVLGFSATEVNNED